MKRFLSLLVSAGILSVGLFEASSALTARELNIQKTLQLQVLRGGRQLAQRDVDVATKRQSTQERITGTKPARLEITYPANGTDGVYVRPYTEAIPYRYEGDRDFYVRDDGVVMRRVERRIPGLFAKTTIDVPVYRYVVPSKEISILSKEPVVVSQDERHAVSNTLRVGGRRFIREKIARGEIRF